jgi:hypothetical protein
MAIARLYVAVQWPYAYEMQNTCLAARYAGEIRDVHLNADRSRYLSRFFPGMSDSSRYFSINSSAARQLMLSFYVFSRYDRQLA